MNSTVSLIPGVTALIRDLTITGGSSPGGGVYIDTASLTLSSVTITGNQSISLGGGIYISAGGSASLIKCKVTKNETGESGGGICNLGTLQLTDSTVSTNTSNGDGGGLFTWGGAISTIDADSEVTGNDPDNCAGPGTLNRTCTNP